MRLTLLEAGLLTALLALEFPAAAASQAKTPAPRPDSSQTKKASKAITNLPLKDLGLISTTQEAREAAAATKKAQGRDAAKSAQADQGGVLEFQPFKGGSSADSPPAKAHPKNAKKPLFKDFHGTAYGAAAGQGSGDRTAGGSAGTSLGKWNVFVKGQRSQTNDPGRPK